MASTAPEEVEVSLRQGIFTNDSLYAIGPRLIEAKNAVWGWRYPHLDTRISLDALPPHFLRIPTFFPNITARTYASSPLMFLDLGWTYNSAVTARRKLIVGTSSASQLRLWEAETGNLIDLAGGVASTTVTTSGDHLPGSSAYWAFPGAGTNIIGSAFFFSHPGATHVYYLLDTSAGNNIRSMTTDVANCPAGAAAITVHLDRLWLAPRMTNGKSVVWYTDPFDAETIRAENFVGIGDEITALLPMIPGDIDASGIARLFVGCKNSIWVIEGDPSTSNAIRRQVISGIGVPSTLAACNTPYGPVCIGSDYQVYLIPTSAQQLFPLSDAIRDRVQVNFDGTVGSNRRASVVWFAPYLYYFPTGDAGYAFLADLSSPQQPIWWGPLNRLPLLSPPLAIVKGTPDSFGSHSTTVNFGPAVYFAGLFGTPEGLYTGFDRFTPSKPVASELGFEVNRQQVISTGFFNRPGYRTVLRRVALETVQKAAAYPWTVRATNEKNLTSLGVKPTPAPIPTSATYSPNKTTTHYYTFPEAFNASSHAVRLTVEGPADVNLFPSTNALNLLRLRVIVQYVSLEN